jgi:hypothetical protein
MHIQRFSALLIGRGLEILKVADSSVHFSTFANPSVQAVFSTRKSPAEGDTSTAPCRGRSSQRSATIES